MNHHLPTVTSEKAETLSGLFLFSFFDVQCIGIGAGAQLTNLMRLNILLLYTRPCKNNPLHIK